MGQGLGLIVPLSPRPTSYVEAILDQKDARRQAEQITFALSSVTPHTAFDKLRPNGARAGEANEKTQNLEPSPSSYPAPSRPAMKSSTISRATSSWYCTGGDFMK